MCTEIQLFGVGWDWVHLADQPQFGLLYQPWMIGNECGAVGGMRNGRGNQSILRKPAPVPGSQQLAASALAWAIEIQYDRGQFVWDFRFSMQ
jgi:hypothetical protein